MHKLNSINQFQIEEEKKLQSQLQETEKRIERYQQSEKASKQKEAMDVDDLDDFMSGLSSEKQMDKTDVRKCRVRIMTIQFSLNFFLTSITT